MSLLNKRMNGFLGLSEAIRLFNEGKSPSTCRTYNSIGKGFSAYLSSKNLGLEGVRPIHVKEFVYMYKAQNSRATCKRFLSAFFRFVGRNDLVDYIKSSLKEVRSEERFKVDLALEEVLRLIAVTGKYEFKLAWSLMAFDGLRPSEVLGLWHEDFDLIHERLFLRRRVGERYGPKGMKPQDKPKTVPLNPLSLELYKKLGKGARHVLPISYKTLRKWFNRSVRQAGIVRPYPITMHKLRHFFGHYWVKQKGNIRVLKEVMRHSKMEYTLLYTAPGEAEVREEFVKVFEGLVR